MMKDTLIKLTASGLILSLGTIACSPNAVHPASASSAPINIKAADRAALRATEALKAHKADQAVKLAERAVAASPNDAKLRVLLGQAYLLAGRFASAETVYKEALTLDRINPRASLNLGIAQLAIGKTIEARQNIERARDLVPATDYGLALALSGDHEEAIPVLEAAARAHSADAKARQNLALAYALAGRWAEARVTAAQDISPADVDARMTAWADLANPTASADQIASLLNVKPSATDGGRPTTLALAITPQAPVLAKADPVLASTAQAELASVEPSPAPAPVAEQAPVAEPVVHQPDVASEPVARSYLMAPTPMVISPPFVHPANAAASKPMFVRPAAVQVPQKPRSSGDFVVQLGAFSSGDRLQAAWKKARGHATYLDGYMPVSTLYRGSLHRLAVSGFRTRDEASTVCRRIQVSGLGCFVRSIEGDTPLRWAARKQDVQIASN